MSLQERIIEAINKLRPFKTGDDPVLWRQNDTIDRVEEIVTRVIRDHFLTDNATESTGEVDKMPTTYAEYLWRQRTEPVFNVAQQPSIQSNVIQGCDHVYFRREESGEEYSWDLVEVDNAFCPLCGVKL